jgi:hypothetical protein
MYHVLCTEPLIARTQQNWRRGWVLGTSSLDSAPTTVGFGEWGQDFLTVPLDWLPQEASPAKQQPDSHYERPDLRARGHLL